MTHAEKHKGGLFPSQDRRLQWLMLLAIGPFCVCVVCVRVRARALAAGVLPGGSASCRSTDLTHREQALSVPVAALSPPSPFGDKRVHKLGTRELTHIWGKTHAHRLTHTHTHIQTRRPLLRPTSDAGTRAPASVCDSEWRVGLFFIFIFIFFST